MEILEKERNRNLGGEREREDTRCKIQESGDGEKG
jgi:hypothetical protein